MSASSAVVELIHVVSASVWPFLERGVGSGLCLGVGAVGGVVDDAFTWMGSGTSNVKEGLYRRLSLYLRVAVSLSCSQMGEVTGIDGAVRGLTTRFVSTSFQLMRLIIGRVCP